MDDVVARGARRVGAVVSAKAKGGRRSWVAQSARRTGGGPHRDRRDKRQGTRKERCERSTRDGW